MSDGPFLVGRLTRRRDGRWVAGVCAGLAAALGVRPEAVRVVAVLLALGNWSAVAVLYGLAWAFLPTDDEDDPGGAGPPRRLVIAGRPADAVDTLAIGAIVAGVVLLLGEVTAVLPGQVVLPALVAVAGAAVAWAWGGRGSGRFERVRPLFVAIGVSLIFAGGFATLAAIGDLDSFGRSAAGAAVLVTGAVLLLGPWIARLARNLAEERRQRIRSEERAEVAAHLHDGVLQTLALIQKRAGDDKAVRSLARRQERELRTWLYGGTNGQADATTVATLLRRELDDLEDHYGVRFDAVLVGDAPLDDAGRALVAAGREAALNAARHAGVEVVDVYLEVEADRTSLFVRDRGRGFDPGTVPPDRRGLADSVIGRVRRQGGTAEVRAAPGEGTEIELSVPRGSS